MRNSKGQFVKGNIKLSNKGDFKKGHKIRLGLKHAIESRERMSKSHIGIQTRENHPMFGKHHSKESLEKMSKTWIQAGHVPWNKGVPCLEETREKLSKVHKGKHYSSETEFVSGEKQRKLAILANKKQAEMKEPTSIEKKVYEELKLRGLLFETQKLINGKFLVDAYIPSLNLVIEADGDYWHSLDKTIKRDKAKNAYLNKCGFKLFRFSESEINKSVKDCIDKISGELL